MVVEIADNEIGEETIGLRECFVIPKIVDRSVEEGDYPQLDLIVTMDGEEVSGGSAINISHEVGSKQLLFGLDEVLVSLVAGTDVQFTTQLVSGNFAGQHADVLVVAQRQG